MDTIQQVNCTVATSQLLAQAFGVSQLAVETHMKGLGTSFIAQGDEARLTEGQEEPPYLAAKAAPLQPPATTKQFHRLPLNSMVDPEVMLILARAMLKPAASL